MMHLRERIRRLATGALVAATAACSTDPMSPPVHPSVEASTVALTGSVSVTKSNGLSLQSVKVAGRLRALPQDVVVSQVIGVAGGTITMPGQGLTLIVPPGAVNMPTTFQVKALAGRTVVYEFQPHGRTFAVPLVFRQQVVETSVGWGQVVRGGYFPDASLIDRTSGRANVSEVLPATIRNGAIEFLIRHFSGYLVSCA